MLKNKGCIHSPPLIKTTENKDNKEKEDMYEYSMDVDAEEQRVHNIILKHFSEPLLPDDSFINPFHHFYTYVKLKPRNDNYLIFCFPGGKYSTLGNHLHNHRSPKEFIHLFIYSLMHLCDSLELLNKISLIHGHLNIYNNILVEQPTMHETVDNRPLIADCSMTLNTLLTNPYDPSNIYIPMELHIFQYMTQNKLQSISEQNLEDILYDVFVDNKLMDPAIATKVALEALDYLSPIYINKTALCIRQTVCQSSHTWDIYALCANYKVVLKEFRVSLEYSKHVELCMRLFHLNMHVNPQHRKDATYIKNAIQKIFSSKRVCIGVDN